MNLQNGYKVIYEKIAGGERTFFADKLDGTVTKQIGDAFKIGEYKLVFEKDGRIFGSTTGKVEDGEPLAVFDEVFKIAEEAEQKQEVTACEHEYANGVCTKCGEADPDYVAPCEHNFVDGICTKCGEQDPDYIAPADAE